LQSPSTSSLRIQPRNSRQETIPPLPIKIYRKSTESFQTEANTKLGPVFKIPEKTDQIRSLPMIQPPATEQKTILGPGECSISQLRPRESKQTTRSFSGLISNAEPNLRDSVIKSPKVTLQLYESSLQKAISSKNKVEERQAYVDIGHSHFFLADFDKSAELYTKALNLSKLEMPKNYSEDLGNLALCYAAGGQYRKADKLNQEALSLTDDSSHKQVLLINQAVILQNLGSVLNATSCWLKAAEITPPSFKPSIYNQVSQILARENIIDAAIDYSRKAENLSRELNSPQGQVDALLDRSKIYRQIGRFARSIEAAEKALAILRSNGMAVEKAGNLVGNIYLDIGDADKAKSFLQFSKDRTSVARLHLSSSDLEKASELYNQLLDGATEGEDVELLFAAHTGLGKVNEANGYFVKAKEHYTIAMSIVEEMRKSLLVSERKNFLAERVHGFQRSEPAKGLVRIALKQNLPYESFQPSESAKSRAFADAISQKISGEAFGVSAEVLEQELDLEDRIAAHKTVLKNQVPKLTSETVAQIKKKIRQLELEKRSFVKTLWKNYPNYASVRYPTPLDLDQSNIKHDEYVIMFDLLGEGLGVRVTRGKQVIWHSLMPVNSDEIETNIKAFLGPFESHKLDKFDPKLASKLYNDLLRRALSEIPEKSEITIIPDGILAVLPFEALVISGIPVWKTGLLGKYPEGITYVSDLYQVTYYQSLTAMTMVRNKGARNVATANAFVAADPIFDRSDVRLSREKGNPTSPKSEISVKLMKSAAPELGPQRLVETDKLASTLSKIYGAQCQIYTGAQCTKEILKQNLDGGIYDAIVIATHGYLSNSVPGFSEPVLLMSSQNSEDPSLLTMTEIAGLKFTSRIAALTACRTGIGDALAGEGVLSMGRAFQCSGAESVLMSLWSVYESSSVVLMEEFFSALRNGKSRIDSLQQARHKLKKAGYHHPFFWAAFVLVGESS
jgi:CHAT domain-containing protein